MQFGKNVRKLRLEKGLSLKELSLLSHVSFSMLSKVERGQKTPTLRVAVQIANALGMSLTHLVGELEGVNASIVRKDQRRREIDPATGTETHYLCPEFRKSGLEYVWLRIPAGSATGKLTCESPGVKGAVLVCQGELTMAIGPTRYFLGEGDCIYYQTDVEHEIINTSGQDAVCYLVADLGKKA